MNSNRNLGMKPVALTDLNACIATCCQLAQLPNNVGVCSSRLEVAQDVEVFAWPVGYQPYGTLPQKANASESSCSSSSSCSSWCLYWSGVTKVDICPLIPSPFDIQASACIHVQALVAEADIELVGSGKRVTGEARYVPTTPAFCVTQAYYKKRMD